MRLIMRNQSFPARTAKEDQEFRRRSVRGMIINFLYAPCTDDAEAWTTDQRGQFQDWLHTGENKAPLCTAVAERFSDAKGDQTWHMGMVSRIGLVWVSQAPDPESWLMRDWDFRFIEPGRISERAYLDENESRVRQALTWSAKEKDRYLQVRKMLNRLSPS